VLQVGPQVEVNVLLCDAVVTVVAVVLILRDVGSRVLIVVLYSTM
jgi:hypothetical protein